MTIDGLTFGRYDAAAARLVADVVEDIYRHSYVDQIACGDPFDTPETFMMRFEAYTSRPDSGFEMIHAQLNGEPIGQIWGWPLLRNTRAWGGLRLDEPEQDREAFTAEDGQRTFALSEIMVRTEHAGHGIASALHRELMDARPEQRAMLLVEPDNARAYTMGLVSSRHAASLVAGRAAVRRADTRPALSEVNEPSPDSRRSAWQTTPTQ